MRPFRSNSFFYAIITIVVLLTTVLVYTGDTKAATAQNTACLGSTEFLANHQLAEQAVDALIQQHPEIYTKDSADLTPEDVQTVAADVAFYASQLALIEAPLAVRATLMTEVAMYYTLSALLYTASVPTAALSVDLTTLYDQAGGSLSGALQYHAEALISVCGGYEAVYGKYLPTDSVG